MGYSHVCSCSNKRALRHITSFRFSRRRFDLFAINDLMLCNRQDKCSFNTPSATGMRPEVNSGQFCHVTKVRESANKWGNYLDVMLWQIFNMSKISKSTDFIDKWRYCSYRASFRPSFPDFRQISPAFLSTAPLEIGLPRQIALPVGCRFSSTLCTAPSRSRTGI